MVVLYLVAKLEWLSAQDSAFVSEMHARMCSVIPKSMASLTVNKHMDSKIKYLELINLSNAAATLFSKHKDAKIFRKLLNPNMLVFIRKLLLSTLL